MITVESWQVTIFHFSNGAKIILPTTELLSSSSGNFDNSWKQVESRERETSVDPRTMRCTKSKRMNLVRHRHLILIGCHHETGFTKSNNISKIWTTLISHNNNNRKLLAKKNNNNRKHLYSKATLVAYNGMWGPRATLHYSFVGETTTTFR